MHDPLISLRLPHGAERDGIQQANCEAAIYLMTQRAIACAMKRAAVIDRTADLLLSAGRADAAERLAHRAAEIRREAAA